jgi:hypothetical protein
MASYAALESGEGRGQAQTKTIKLVRRQSRRKNTRTTSIDLDDRHMRLSDAEAKESWGRKLGAGGSAFQCEAHPVQRPQIRAKVMLYLEKSLSSERSFLDLHSPILRLRRSTGRTANGSSRTEGDGETVA